MRIRLARPGEHEALENLQWRNPAARIFYEKCGFTVEGDAKTRFGPALRMAR